jgi:hypothetical protein
MATFNEVAFKQQIEESIKVATTILEKNRNPRYPSDVFHKYDDKYLLIELLYAKIPVRSFFLLRVE